MKDALIVYVIFAFIGASPLQAEKFDDGMLKTDKKACQQALSEYTQHINACQFHSICTEQDGSQLVRVTKIEQFVINHCHFEVIQ